MKQIVSLLIAGVLATNNLAWSYQASVETPPIRLMPGMGHLRHPVSTRNREAQEFFNQGLRYIYAFNHDAAYRSFQRAAQLDPQLAMAYWGMALALGSNINKQVVSDEEYQAYDLIQKALKLAPNVPPAEQAYIHALAQRYTNDPNPDYKKLDQAYATAMRQLVKNYPDDLDAATLFAESLMDLAPWQLWTLQGEPREGTLEVVGILESVLKRDPQHMGANHYYIHAVEQSPHPEYALVQANRLRFIAPASGHLVHMPSHIYFLTGDYYSAAKANEEAINADYEYIREYGMAEDYPLHYMGHNLDMLARSYSMQGRFNDAIRAADELARFSAPHFKEHPELEFRMIIPVIYTLLRFNRWQEILNLPKPNPSMLMTTAMWYAARGMAYAALGKVPAAIQEREQFLSTLKEIPQSSTFDLNPTHKILQIADDLLQARMAQAEHQNEKFIAFLQKAIAEEDAIAYSEPAGWYYPIRETLGGELLRQKRYPEAEQVFRQSLEKYPRNGRALFGLAESLRGQNKTESLFWVQQEYQQAWKNADFPLSINDL